MVDTNSSNTHSIDTPPPIATSMPLMYGPVMPHPGQPGAVYFDNTDITEFLYRWNIECEDFGLTDAQKCVRIPDYCTPETKDVIELLDEYKTNDWTKLRSELKGLFWQHDKPKDTTASLNKLIHDAQGMDLNVFILKYASISQAFIDKGALSPLDRVSRLLDGLDSRLREKVLDYCMKKDWRLSSHDTGTEEPDFDDLKQFIIGKAQLAQKQIVYDKERAIREGAVTSNVPILTKVTPATTATPVTPALSPMERRMAELMDQFSQLTLLLQANLTRSLNNTDAEGSAPFGTMLRPRPWRESCCWCDSFEHIRKFCPAFMEHLRDGLVHFDEQWRLFNVATGAEIPLNYGRGGQEVLFKQQAAATAAPKSVFGTSATNAITLEPQYATLGAENSVILTTLYDDGTARHHIIDVDVNEKRKWDDIIGQQGRRVRFRDDETPTPSPPTVPRPASAAPIPSVVQQPSAQQFPTPQTNPEPSTTTTPGMAAPPNQPKKYRLASDLSETLPISVIGEKLMDTPVCLTVRDVLSASSEISNYMHDQTRKRRVPIDSQLEAMVMSTTPAPTSVPPIVAEINNTTLTPLYACPSGRANVLLDGRVKANSLLDDGSEVCIMARRIFDQLDFPIDTDIEWRIRTFNKEAGAHGCLGLCHAVPVDIGGVEVKVPIFVMEDSEHDLLLGRPWGKMARAAFINEDNGDYVCRIKSPDGRRIVQFVAAKADHPRNRSFAREVDGSLPVEHLKV